MRIEHGSTLGISLADDYIGFCDNNMNKGQKSLSFITKSSRTHLGTPMKEIAEYLRLIFNSRRYAKVAVVASEYSMSTKSFSAADFRSKQIGVVMLIAAELGVKFIEISAASVSLMATGKSRTDYAGLTLAAESNGVKINGQYATEAYWVMMCANKDR